MLSVSVSSTVSAQVAWVKVRSNQNKSFLVRHMVAHVDELCFGFTRSFRHPLTNNMFDLILITFQRCTLCNHTCQHRLCNWAAILTPYTLHTLIAEPHEHNAQPHAHMTHPYTYIARTDRTTVRTHRTTVRTYTRIARTQRTTARTQRTTVRAVVNHSIVPYGTESP